MADNSGTLTVRYFAAAAAAAGRDMESRESGRVADVISAACDEHEALRPVAGVSTFLLDGLAVDLDADAPAGATLDVLPPFAGG